MISCSFEFPFPKLDALPMLEYLSSSWKTTLRHTEIVPSTVLVGHDSQYSCSRVEQGKDDGDLSAPNVQKEEARAYEEHRNTWLNCEQDELLASLSLRALVPLATSTWKEINDPRDLSFGEPLQRFENTKDPC